MRCLRAGLLAEAVLLLLAVSFLTMYSYSYTKIRWREEELEVEQFEPDGYAPCEIWCREEGFYDH